jgi:hypothetical protein
VTIAKPDLRQLDANAGGDPLPHRCHLGSEGIAFALERKITEILPRRKQLVEVPLQETEIECQVEPVPTSERWREEIVHGVSIGESPPIQSRVPTVGAACVEAHFSQRAAEECPL